MTSPPLRPSRHHGTPQPLSASSRYLLFRRAEVSAYYPDDRIEVAPGAFETAYDARRWADRVHPDADLVEVTVYERPGGDDDWRTLERWTRRNGAWG